MATVTEIRQVWFSTSEAAKATGKHPKTIMKACQTGSLVAVQPHPGAHWRIHVDDLDTWMRDGGKA